ncbi:1-aminocyclopropane-1-carboxylate deaminase/D-cysteine desulfhydrase [Gramella jeungdoensis]|uniref:1-aminocyclopropane-1-carboxylate deaminase/D-cysteine desulfhydrase n=1 Tax=Gramella jeungdoensis TaxID=708091 RepID=A0A4Y8AQV8_9FLAO|nr:MULTISPECIES: pyridoxal-phosphate dependent enzyme [Flavobacteriaceae]TEW73165.1 1-aminocyclopropane-1-carboxylate deaminase/D-cysteine desulfhydrase [Gramella jeungdoensis]
MEQVYFSEIADSGVSLFIKREDKLHPFISGNKYRKLKYNLVEAKNQEKMTLITFGGAYSNHIAASAAAGSQFGFNTIGVIRGEELANNLEEVLQNNPTLKFASKHNMQFHFVSRSAYREKTSKEFLDNLKQQFGDFYLVPEGGTNTFAVKGCEEILTERDIVYNVICSSVGTGGTISGIINSTKEHQKTIGFPALKGDFLQNEIKKYVLTNKNWSLNTNYHFGGYAKVSETLINFINKFKGETGIPLDPVYTGKMLFGIVDLIKNDYFEKGTSILAIHTGGLQGIDGMNVYLKNKKLVEIV